MIRTVLAPAKVNLGLEVLGRRLDGFHDIATVFQTISIFDRLQVFPAESDRVVVINGDEQIADNLVSRTLAVAREHGITDGHWDVRLDKRIPLAAGLGGASADAAATLVAVADECGRSALAEAALQLGSDVPFLLTGGAALASGRGEILQHLPGMVSCWFVLASPEIALERKTALLYNRLRVEDFTDGTRVSNGADALRRRSMPDPGDLGNAFQRPLAELMPELDVLRQAFFTGGAPWVALSGAGPTHYTIVPSLSRAIQFAKELAGNKPFPMRVMLGRPMASGPLIVRKTIDTAPTL